MSDGEEPTNVPENVKRFWTTASLNALAALVIHATPKGAESCKAFLELCKHVSSKPHIGGDGVEDMVCTKCSLQLTFAAHKVCLFFVLFFGLI